MRASSSFVGAALLCGVMAFVAIPAESQVSVRLLGSPAPETLPTSRIKLSLGGMGVVAINDQVIDATTLAGELEKIFRPRATEQRVLYVELHDGATGQQIVQVVDAARPMDIKVVGWAPETAELPY